MPLSWQIYQTLAPNHSHFSLPGFPNNSGPARSPGEEGVVGPGVSLHIPAGNRGSSSGLMEAGTANPAPPPVDPYEVSDSVMFPELYLRAHSSLFTSSGVHRRPRDMFLLLALMTELENWRKREESKPPNWHLTQPPQYTDGKTETRRTDMSKVGPRHRAGLDGRPVGS